MRATVPALITGILFGAGLALSDMINPARVLAFLDLTGSWDPTLAFVMAGAVAASAAGYFAAHRRRTPVFGRTFFIPENRLLDRQLIAGAAVFGIGWGLVGFCPGPIICALALGVWQAWLFAAAMVLGMFLHRATAGLGAPPTRSREPRAARASDA